MTDRILEEIKSKTEDAVLWKADCLFRAAITPDDIQAAVDSIATTLACIDGEVKRDRYIDLICERLKIKRSHLKNALKHLAVNEDDAQFDANDEHNTHREIPEWANKERLLTHGLDWREDAGPKTGIYYHSTTGQLQQMTNFVIKPLFHLRSSGSTESKRLALIHSNTSEEDMLIEFPSKVLASVDAFEVALLDRGNLNLFDQFAKAHLRRLVRALGNNFPTAYELNYLGWQGEGFFSYADAVFDGREVKHYNKLGLITVADKTFYSPASSNLYSSERKDEDNRDILENDPYENDKHLIYRKAPISFEQWAQHMVQWHGTAGIPLVCYVFVTLFKDVVLSIAKCPILYGYGEVQSGKSTWAECLYYLFYDEKSKGFNLNDGTIFAFFNRLERFKNCVQYFNEFDEDAIREEFFRAFKAFWDGEGRDKGLGIKNKVGTQKTNCSIVLAGQTLSTKDGASVLSRCIPEKFTNPGVRSEKDVAAFQKWRSWVKQGMNGCLVDVLKYRAAFKKDFVHTFNENTKKLKAALKNDNVAIQERIINNYNVILTAGQVMLQYLQLGFTTDQLFQYCTKNIEYLSRMMSEVDDRSTFWKIVAYLFEQGVIKEEHDYKIREEEQIRCVVDGIEQDIAFEKTEKLLYIRLAKIYPAYCEALRRTTGGKPINERTLITYFESNKKAFVGSIKSTRFRHGGTSNAYIFKYSKLGIHLERDEAPETTAINEIFEIKQLEQFPTYIELKAYRRFEVTTTDADGKPKTIWHTHYVSILSSKHQSMLPELSIGTRIRVQGTYTPGKTSIEKSSGSVAAETITIESKPPAPISFGDDTEAPF